MGSEVDHLFLDWIDDGPDTAAFEEIETDSGQLLPSPDSETTSQSPSLRQYRIKQFRQEYYFLLRSAISSLAEDGLMQCTSSVHGKAVVSQCEALLSDYSAFMRVAERVADSLGTELWQVIGSTRSPNPRTRFDSATGHFAHLLSSSTFDTMVQEFRDALQASDVLTIADPALLAATVAAILRRLFDETLLDKLSSMTTSILTDMDTDMDTADSLQETLIYVVGYSLSQIRQGCFRNNTTRWNDIETILRTLYSANPDSSGLPESVLCLIRDRSMGALLTPVATLGNFFLDLEPELASSTESAISDVFWAKLSQPLTTVIYNLSSNLAEQPSTVDAFEDTAKLLLSIFRRIYARGLTRRHNDRLASRNRKEREAKAAEGAERAKGGDSNREPGSGIHSLRKDLIPNSFHYDTDQ